MLRSRLLADFGQLALAAAASRVLGLVYRVLLARAIGAEGLGLFQLALPIYLVGLTLCSLGLSLGTTKLVAAAAARGDLARAARIRRQAVGIGAAAGAAGTLALLALSPALAAGILRDPRVAAPLGVLAWALPIAAVEGIYRGYWQGLRRMARVGGAHVAENAVRLLVLLALMAALPALSAATAAAVAASLMVLGEVVELVAVTARAGSDPAVRPPGPEGAPAGQMLRISLPVAFSRIAGTLGLALDAALIPARLRAGGLDALAATAAFGRFMGMVMPLVTFPTVLMGPLAAALVPSVAEAAERAQWRGIGRRAAVAALAAAAAGVATAVLLLAAPQRLGMVLYGQADLGRLLADGALIAPGLFLTMAAGAILNGLGRTAASFGAQLAGGTCRLALIFLWVPTLGISGAALATAVGFGLSAAAAWGAAGVYLRRA